MSAHSAGVLALAIQAALRPQRRASDGPSLGRSAIRRLYSETVPLGGEKILIERRSKSSEASISKI